MRKSKENLTSTKLCRLVEPSSISDREWDGCRHAADAVQQSVGITVAVQQSCLYQGCFHGQRRGIWFVQHFCAAAAGQRGSLRSHRCAAIHLSCGVQGQTQSTRLLLLLLQGMPGSLGRSQRLWKQPGN